MASISIVEYLLKLGGNLPAGAKEAAAAVDRLERSADKAKLGIEKLGRMAGGPLGHITDLAADATDVMDALGASMGAAGIVAGGAAVAFAGLAVGAKVLADAAVDAADRLTKQGLASEIPTASLASVVAYKEASAELRNEIDLLVVSMAGPALDALTNLADVTSGVTGAFLDASEAGTDWRESVEDLGVPVSETKTLVEGLGTAMITLGLSIPFKAFADYMGDVRAMKQATIELNAEVAKGMEAFAKGHVLPKLVGGGGPAVPDLSSLPMSGDDMMAALGLGGPGKPKGASSSGASSPAGPNMDAWAKEVVREGNMAAESAAGDARAQARTDAFLAGLDLTTEGIDGLIDELQASQDATDRLTATTGQAAMESAAKTQGLISAIIGAATEILNLPRMLDEVVRDLPDLLINGAIKGTASMVESIPQVFESLLTELPAVLIEVAPRMALGFVAMGPRIALSIVDALIDGFGSLFSVDFWADAGRSLAEAIGDALNSLVNPFNATGKIGTDLTPAKGERAKFLGIKLPSFDSAMRQPMEITRTGLAMVHAGETIGKSGGGRGIVVNVNVGTTIGAGAGVELARVIRRELGSYGLGGSVTPAYP